MRRVIAVSVLAVLGLFSLPLAGFSPEISEFRLAVDAGPQGITTGPDGSCGIRRGRTRSAE